MHENPRRARFGKRRNEFIRIFYHQVHVKNHVGNCFAQRRNYGRPNRDARHKVSVHHVHMQQRPSTFERQLGVGGQVREIRGKYGRRKFYSASHVASLSFSIADSSRARVPVAQAGNLQFPWPHVALRAALHREFQRVHHPQSLLQRDERPRFSENYIAHIRVKIPVISTQRRDFSERHVARVELRQRSPLFLFFNAPVFAARRMPRAQQRFLRVEILMHVHSLRAQHAKMRPLNRYQRPRRKVRAQSIRVIKRHVERVVVRRIFTFGANVRQNRFRSSKQRQRVIKQVRPEIVENSRARSGPLFPRIANCRTAPVKRFFKLQKPPQLARSDQLLDSTKIAVQPSLLINRQQPSRLFRDGNQFLRFGNCRCKRFIQHHVFAGFHARLRQRRMRFIRCRNRNQTNFRNRQQLFYTADNFRPRINLCRVVACSLQHGGEPQPRHRSEKRCVKGAPAQSKSNQSAINHVCPSANPILSLAPTPKPSFRPESAKGEISLRSPISATTKSTCQFCETAFACSLLRRQNAMMSSKTQIPQGEGVAPSPVIFCLLSAGFIVNGIVISFIGPLLPVFSAKWGLDDARAGYFLLVQFLASFIGVLLSSRLIAAKGFKPAITLGLALLGIGFTLLSAPTFHLALAASGIYGLGYGFNTPGTNLWVSESYGERRASALNVVNLAWGVGAIASSPLAKL